MFPHSRGFAAVTGMALIALVSACGSGSGGGSSAKGDTLTIGVFVPTSGASSPIGKEDLAVLNALVKKTNDAGGIDGKVKIKLNVKNETLEPTAAIAAMREFGNEKTDFVIGFVSSSDCIAAAPYMDRLNITVLGYCQDSSMIGSGRRSKHFFSALYPVSAASSMLAITIAKEYPDVQQISTLGSDVVFSKTLIGDTLKKLSSSGTSFRTGPQAWVPFDQANFSSQVAAIRSASVGKRSGLIYSILANELTFVKQVIDTKLPIDLKFIATAGSYDLAARALNGTAPDVWNTANYGLPELWDNKIDDEFVKLVKDATGFTPSANAYSTYIAYHTLELAVAKATSTDSDKVYKAMEGITFDAPTGVVSVNADTHWIEQSLVAYQTRGDAGTGSKTALVKAYKLPPVTTPTADDLKLVFPLHGAGSQK